MEKLHFSIWSKTNKILICSGSGIGFGHWSIMFEALFFFTADNSSQEKLHYMNFKDSFRNVLYRNKLKSLKEMKEGWMKSDEGWMKSDEGWMKNDERWGMQYDDFKQLRGFAECWHKVLMHIGSL